MSLVISQYSIIKGKYMMKDKRILLQQVVNYVTDLEK